MLIDGGPKSNPVSKICHISYNDETWHSYTLPKEDLRNIQITWDSPWVFESLKAVLISMVVTLMMSAKLATLGLLKIKVFWNKGYDVIISVYGITKKNYVTQIIL